MKNACISHKPGDTVQLAGIDFVVLEDRSPFSGEAESHDLFILALEGQGTSQFGDTNNYAESVLKDRVEDWLYRLTEKMTEQGLDADLIRTRTISLTTLDGYKGYGELEVKAAPLTLDEARRCAEAMPDPDIASWLATGWGGPEHGGASGALFVRTNGSWGDYYCSYGGYAVRPALVVSSSLFASTESDLSSVSTDDLLSELRRRIGEACLLSPQHRYLFLTKYPERYLELDAAGALPCQENFWYGSTATNPETDQMMYSDRFNTFVSIEPLLGPFGTPATGALDLIDWFIVGAETGNRKGKVVPEKAWVKEIVDYCDAAGKPVFMKDSLIPIVDESLWRRAFPWDGSED